MKIKPGTISLELDTNGDCDQMKEILDYYLKQNENPTETDEYQNYTWQFAKFMLEEMMKTWKGKECNKFVFMKSLENVKKQNNS